jgi:hypothetical protein
MKIILLLAPFLFLAATPLAGAEAELTEYRAVMTGVT